jgi:hypothetical protein
MRMPFVNGTTTSLTRWSNRWCCRLVNDRNQYLRGGKALFRFDAPDVRIEEKDGTDGHAMYKHRAALFPSHYFRVAYDDLRMRQPSHKEYMQILHLAAKQSETQVEAALRELLTREQPIATAVEALLGKSSPSENSYHCLVSETQVAFRL